MKRLSIILLICILISALSLPAFAVDTGRSYSFELTADDKDSAAISVGDILTVKLTLKTAESCALYAMQDEIMYDKAYFQLVDGSVTVTEGYQSGLRDMEDSSYAKVLMNFVSGAMDGEIQAASVQVGSFRLKAIAAGTSTVMNDDYYCTTQTGTSKYASSAGNLQVTIADSPATLTSISASFNQGGSTIYADTALINLKPMLTVTAHYSNDSSVTLTSSDYSLSGTLTAGTSVVTVNHQDKFTTFNVTVTESSGSSGTGGGGGGGGTSPGGESPKGAAAFTDVPPSAWFYDAVDYVVTNDLFSGTTATTFEPGSVMTRGMLVLVLYRLEGQPSTPVSSQFPDVSPSAWYADAVAWAAEKQVVIGYTNGKFGPSDPVTREELATILYRYCNLKGYDMTASGDISVFTDSGKVHDYALSAVKWAVGSGLITGYGNGTLDPIGHSTRAQVAVIMMRLGSLTR